MNVANLLVRSALHHPERPLWIDGSRSISYGEGRQRLDAIASALRHRGEHGDRVAILSSNRFEAFEIYLAAMRAGMVAVPMNPKLHPSEYAYILSDSGAKFFAFSANFEDVVQQIGKEISLPSHLFRIGGEGGGNAQPYEALLEGELHPYIGSAIDPNETAWLFYTSGTTGRPKGAMETHRNLVTMIHNFLTSGLGEASETDVMLHLAPISHGTASIGLVYLARGGAQAFPLSKSFEAPKVFEAIQRFGVTATMLAPTMVQLLMRSDERTSFDLSTLRTVVYGGAPMHRGVLDEAMAAFGPIFMQGFGQGEAAAACAILSKADHVVGDDPDRERRLNSVGRPPIAVMMRIADEEGNTLPVGVSGEILVQGDLVMSGYWNNPEATANTIKDGWLHTGDVGYLDEGGYLFLTDRVKDMIISGGSNIYPREIEEVLYQHPDVAEVSVIGVPDPKWGESVLAVVVPRADTEPTEESLIEHCKNHIASFKKPKAVAFVDALPKSANGKVLKRVLREQFGESAPAATPVAG